VIKQPTPRRVRIEQRIALGQPYDFIAECEDCTEAEVRKVWRQMSLIRQEELDAEEVALESRSNMRSGKLGVAKRAEPKRLRRSNPALAPTGTSSRG
jgi:hypothetical protein